jgi:hypothetical protein
VHEKKLLYPEDGGGRFNESFHKARKQLSSVNEKLLH